MTVTAAAIDNPQVSREGPQPPQARDAGETLVTALARTAHRHASHGITYIEKGAPWNQQDYPTLVDEASRIRTGLLRAGAKVGDIILFQFSANRDFIPAFWACMLGGYVPVPLAPIHDEDLAAAPVRRLLNARDLLHPAIVLASPSIVGFLHGLPAGDAPSDLKILSIADARQSEPSLAWHEPHPDDLALLLLTSGSTGKPKAVRQTHRNLLAWATSVAPACGFTPSDISLNWMPLDHVGGIVMFHLRDLVTGCRQFHGSTEMVLRDPLTWLDWMEATRATITWAPNFAFALINDQEEAMTGRQWDLSVMWFILNGGEPIVSKTARRFMRLLMPHGLRPTAMRPAWGMSETSSGVTYSSSFSLESSSDSDPFVYVGKPIPGIDIRVVDSAGHVVAEDAIGRLEVRGISVTPGYHGDVETTKGAFTPDGWFMTGDLATIRKGELAIAGREKEVIIVNGANYFCHELESIVEEIDGVEVTYTAACPVRPHGEDAEKVAVFFVPKSDVGSGLTSLRRSIRRQVTLRAGVTPDFVIPLTSGEIPKTSIGKIQRAELRQRFERGEYATGLPTAAEAGAIFSPAWRPAENRPSVSLAPGSRVLIMAGSGGLGEAVRRRLVESGHPAIVVLEGEQFFQDAPDRFRVNSAIASDFARLFDALGGAADFPTHIVHAWAHDEWIETTPSAAALESRASGSVSLLHLLRTLEPLKAAVRIVVATSGAIPTCDSDPIEDAKLPLIGLVRAFAHESDTIKLSLLDLPADSIPAGAEQVIAELQIETSQTIAIRDGKRLLPTLEPAKAERAAGTTSLRAGGWYLMSGGTGEVARVLAHHLVGKYGAKLVLMGRKRETSAWPDLELQDHTIFLAGDISDPHFVRRAFDLGRQRWGGPLRGVFHLAGSYHEAPLASETAAGFVAALHPKLAGALALNSIAQENPGCLFVNFSSLLGYFGAFGTGAYSAANAALDAFSANQRLFGINAYSLAWSMWQGTGMGRLVDGEVVKQRGFQILDPTAALQLLDTVLGYPPGHYLIGLDPDGRAALGAGATRVAGDEAADVPPATELQARLARMWQDILKVPNVGITHSFFDLGGSSLLAARLFGRMEKELGVNLPIATLYSSPTIENLAELIASTPPRPATTALMTPMQTDKSGSPLFCIAGVGGDAIAFQEMAELVGQNRPFYALQVRGLDGVRSEEAPPTIEGAARDFVEMITAVQPSGPCNVAGHCFGALIAWEVARQLRAQKREIGLLALIDPVVSTEFPDQIIRQDRLQYSFQQFMGVGILPKLRLLRDKIFNVRRAIVIRQRLGRSISMARAMYDGYTPLPYAGHASVFLASQSFFDMAPQRDPRRHFERIATDGVTYTRITGDHDTMMRGDGARELVDSFSKVLGDPRPSRKSQDHGFEEQAPL